MKRIGKNQCEHGSLARKCLVCELTEEVKQLREENDRLNVVITHFIHTANLNILQEFLKIKKEEEE